MIHRVQHFIKTEHLLAPVQPVLVCVSGGADSVALLDVLLQLGYPCIVAHCNFHLRGNESMRDQHFVEQLCEQLKVKLRIRDFDTTTYANEHRLSIEMAARELRYKWFDELARQEGCSAIAVAHHQNDQAETLLLNLKRGTGLRGLAGMRPMSANPVVDNGIPIIRPLLCTTRKYIEHYLRDKRQLPWVDDSTNTNTQFSRNAVRQQLNNYTDAEIENMAQTARHIQGYVDWLEKQETDAAKRTQLYEQLREYRFTEPEKIYDALQRGIGGKTFYSPTHTAIIRHGKLIINKNE